MTRRAPFTETDPGLQPEAGIQTIPKEGTTVSSNASYPDHALDRDETLFAITDLLGKRVQACAHFRFGSRFEVVNLMVVGTLKSWTGQHYGDDGPLHYGIGCHWESRGSLNFLASAVRDGAQMFGTGADGIAMRVHLSDGHTDLCLYETEED